jgi:hypothetical protein
VDGGDKTCQDDEFCVEVIKKATYPRWRNYGTLWGVSRYSLVGVVNEDGRFLMAHAKTMYFQMASLVLLYRSMIISLSKEIQQIIKKFKEKDELDRNTIKEIRNNSKELYRNYLNFLNGIYFQEITPQEQGIELYKKLLEVSDIKSILDSFDREMEELDNFIDIMEEKQRNDNLEFLSILGAMFLPASFLISLLGMNIIKGNGRLDIGILIIILIFSFLASIGYLCPKKLFDIIKIKKLLSIINNKWKSILNFNMDELSGKIAIGSSFVLIAAIIIFVFFVH